MKTNATIESLRAETHLFKDAIVEAIAKLGPGHVVARKLSKALGNARYQPAPCRRCNRLLRNLKSIQAGYGPKCREISASGKQDNFNLKGGH